MDIVCLLSSVTFSVVNTHTCIHTNIQIDSYIIYLHAYNIFVSSRATTLLCSISLAIFVHVQTTVDGIVIHLSLAT